MKIDTTLEEVKLIDLSNIASFLFIITILISISLNINEKNVLLNEETLYTKDEAKRMTKINRLIILGLLLTYLYISFKTREIDKINDKDLSKDNLQILVSVLSVIGGLIILYLVFNDGEGASSIDNPTL